MSYAGARDNYSYIVGQPPPKRKHKLTELARPSCEVLLSEVYNNDDRLFTWHQLWSLSFRRDPNSLTVRVRLREQGELRHFGGALPNRNGLNWLFADGHVAWHSAASIARVFCCQDFGPNHPNRGLQDALCNRAPDDNQVNLGSRAR